VRASGGRLGGYGIATAGMVIGVLTTLALVVAVLLVFIAIAGSVGDSNS
jgi:hypothetical protein